MKKPKYVMIYSDRDSKNPLGGTFEFANNLKEAEKKRIHLFEKGYKVSKIAKNALP